MFEKTLIADCVVHISAALAAEAMQALLRTTNGRGSYIHERLSDFDSDGCQERTAWVSLTQALLAVDLTGDGVVNDAANENDWRLAA